MRCRNGLHEIDPNDPWRGKGRERCRECFFARHRRANQSEKGREAKRRYRQSEKGREAQRRNRQKRIRFGDTYLGCAPTIEQAQEINTYLAQRLADFTSQQRDERKEASDGWRNGTAVA